MSAFYPEDIPKSRHKARACARSVVLRTTPTMRGASLFNAATAMRACRNPHLSTLIRWRETSEPVEQCFDNVTFEHENFTALVQIVASHVAPLKERNMLFANCSGQQKNAFAECRRSSHSWSTKKRNLTPHGATDEEGCHLKDADKVCGHWAGIIVEREKIIPRTAHVKALSTLSILSTCCGSQAKTTLMRTWWCAGGFGSFSPRGHTTNAPLLLIIQVRFAAISQWQEVRGRDAQPVVSSSPRRVALQSGGSSKNHPCGQFFAAAAQIPMPTIASAFRTRDAVIGIKLIHVPLAWTRNEWMARDCPYFRDMTIAKVAKCTWLDLKGTSISGPFQAIRFAERPTN